MERDGNNLHLDTREARAGGGPHAMIYVLGFGVVLAIIVVAAIWMAKAPAANGPAAPMPPQATHAAAAPAN